MISASSRFIILGGLFSVFAISFYAVYLNIPILDEESKSHFKYPRNIEDAKNLGRLLSKYKDDHLTTMMFGVITLYILLQSFAIPGSIFLTILSGYLFNFFVALLLVCTCSATGAAICYLLSYLFGRDIVLKRFPERIQSWQAEIGKHDDNLLSYIIFLRVTPLLPNWFINIASPVLNVPIFPFFLGTFLGVAPPSFLYIQAGSTLEQMTHTNIAWSYDSIIMLTVFALLSLAPVLWKKVNKSKVD